MTQQHIPEELVAETYLENQSVVDMSLADGKIIITVNQPQLTLDDLLKDITDDNLHSEKNRVQTLQP